MSTLEKVRLEVVESDLHGKIEQLIGVDDKGTEFFIPKDPRNRHYIEAQQWYDKQKKKPFKYEF